jgi:hypothetical protein
MLLQAVRHNYRENQKEALFCLATDLPALEAAILAVPDCRLVVIDPITAYLGDTDSHKNAEIRGLIAPLAALAAKHGVAIVCVTHLNKSGSGPAIYRSIGSIAFVAAARAAWAVVKDRDNPRRRLMLPAKNNLAPDALGLAYSLEPYGLNGTAVVAWEPEPVDITADEAMKPDVGKGAKKERDRARAWLRETLQAGPMLAADVYAQGKANGFRDRAIRFAFDDLDGQRKKSDFKGGWLWWLPSGEDTHSAHKESSAPSQKHEDFHEHAEDAHSAPGESSAPSQKHEDFHEDAEDAYGQKRESSHDDDWGEV